MGKVFIIGTSEDLSRLSLEVLIEKQVDLPNLVIITSTEEKIRDFNAFELTGVNTRSLSDMQSPDLPIIKTLDPPFTPPLTRAERREKLRKEAKYEVGKRKAIEVPDCAHPQKFRTCGIDGVLRCGYCGTPMW